jgi:N6-adenosine-specific RNA methylase IME4
MKYEIIYADPAWQYRDKASAGKRGACHKYDVMTLEAIKRLDVLSLAADDCLLAMWWVPPMPVEALGVVTAWGFKLKTMQGFTWHKLSRTGAKDHFGMGNYTRANAECCLFAVRGKPKRICAAVRSLIVAPVGKHSAKPDEARQRLAQLMGDVPRVELFARTQVSGWDSVGFDIDGQDIGIAIRGYASI